MSGEAESASSSSDSEYKGGGGGGRKRTASGAPIKSSRTTRGSPATKPPAARAPSTSAKAIKRPKASRELSTSTSGSGSTQRGSTSKVVKRTSAYDSPDGSVLMSSRAESRELAQALEKDQAARRGSSSLSDQSSKSTMSPPPVAARGRSRPNLSRQSSSREVNSRASSRGTAVSEDEEEEEEEADGDEGEQKVKVTGKGKGRAGVSSEEESSEEEADEAPPARGKAMKPKPKVVVKRRDVSSGDEQEDDDDERAATDQDDDDLSSSLSDVDMADPTPQPSKPARGRGRPRGTKRTFSRGPIASTRVSLAPESKPKKSPMPEAQALSPVKARATRATVTLPAGYIEGVKSARMTKPRPESEKARSVSVDVDVPEPESPAVAAKGKKVSKGKEKEVEKKEELLVVPPPELERQLSKRRKLDNAIAEKAAERAAARLRHLQDLDDEAERVRSGVHPLLEFTYQRLAEEKALRLAQLKKYCEQQEAAIEKDLEAETETAWKQWADAKHTLRLDLYLANHDQLKQLIFEEKAYPFLRDHPLLVNTHSLPPVPYFRGPAPLPDPNPEFGARFSRTRYVEPPPINLALDHTSWELDRSEIESDIALFAEFNEPFTAAPSYTPAPIPPYQYSGWQHYNAPVPAAPPPSTNPSSSNTYRPRNSPSIASNPPPAHFYPHDTNRSSHSHSNATNEKAPRHHNDRLVPPSATSSSTFTSPQATPSQPPRNTFSSNSNANPSSAPVPASSSSNRPKANGAPNPNPYSAFGLPSVPSLDVSRSLPGVPAGSMSLAMGMGLPLEGIARGLRKVAIGRTRIAGALLLLALLAFSIRARGWTPTPTSAPSDLATLPEAPLDVFLPSLAHPGPLVRPGHPTNASEMQGWTRPTSSVVRLESSSWAVPTTLDPTARYLTYTSHSGFHNQRISLVNAIVLAKVLNRTLLLPPVTLGKSVDWAPSPKLLKNVIVAESAVVSECRQLNDRDVRRERCGIYWNARRGDWAWFIDPSLISNHISVINRPAHDHAWIHSNLGILESEIHTFRDSDRRSYRIHDTVDDNAVPEGSVAGSYSYRLNVDDLLDMDDYKLLEFGSIYGTSRLVLRSEENKAFKEEMHEAMVYKQELFETVSEAVVRRLGGRGTYNALHLRLGGHDKFQLGARSRTATVFKTLLMEVYALPEALVDDLLLKNRRHPSTDPTYRPLPLDRPAFATAFRPSPNLICPSVLYPPSSPLAALNTPLYVATDSTNPRSDVVIEMFRNTFPCLFFLSDFRSKNAHNSVEIDELKWFAELVDEEGEILGSFLEPFVDAEVIAKGKKVVGTPGSTFSQFVLNTLWPHYNDAWL